MFHLAIPSRDITESVDFYKKLGCRIGRTYQDSAILDFFGHQLVVHKSNKTDKKPRMYPRHFGYIFSTQEEFANWIVATSDIPTWQKVMPRHWGEPGEHVTFFLCDPSNNLIEFKFYTKGEAL